jgi:erythronate-4-phosphate dehydrogenase
VKFVGTATTGFEHLDMEGLEAAGVGVSVALGCNARSVAEWVAAVLLELLPDDSTQGKTLGVIGRGRIGSQVVKLAETLGLRVLVNDPPLEKAGVAGEFVPLDQLLRESDFVTLHTPLTRDGAHPTFHLIGKRELSLLKSGATLINASRGAVLDNAAALGWITRHRHRGARLVLDVFEGEPRPHQKLVQACSLATPHIAGYSWEGKINGTRQTANALREFFNLSVPAWEPALEPPAQGVIKVAGDDIASIRQAVRQIYDIRADDAALRNGLSAEADEWAAHFQALRKNYPRRREFSAYDIQAPGEMARRFFGIGPSS